MMRMIAGLMMFFGLIILSGCAGPAPKCYPISGEPCAPDDPVHNLRADMVPPL